VISGSLRALTGVAAGVAGAGLTSSGAAAIFGGLLLAWAADQYVTGLQEIIGNEHLDSYGGKTIKNYTGGGLTGDLLAFTYDVGPACISANPNGAFRGRVRAAPLTRSTKASILLRFGMASTELPVVTSNEVAKLFAAGRPAIVASEDAMAATRPLTAVNSVLRTPTPAAPRETARLGTSSGYYPFGRNTLSAAEANVKVSGYGWKDPKWWKTVKQLQAGESIEVKNLRIAAELRKDAFPDLIRSRYRGQLSEMPDLRGTYDWHNPPYIPLFPRGRF